MNPRVDLVGGIYSFKMSAYTTIRVTREAARLKALSEIINARDDELTRVLDIFMESRLYNVSITGDEDDNDNDLIGN